ncbi:MAG: lipoprotein-releasing ABC transporter permease subunit [Gammaproteobacteria bacterium]|nr:lipoprotein-releasing ABC transporter permease subunit [Gammaproteobacteria bacterium]
MTRSLPVFVGLRYTRAQRENHFISFISLISMLGIALGVWALITVLSVMNGFERELRDRILGVAAHVTVSGVDGWLRDWPAISADAERRPEVAANAPYILGQGMVVRSPHVTGALIRGILPDREQGVSEFSAHMVAGRLSYLIPGEFGIVLGDALMRRLRLNVGDKVTLVTPQGQVTPAGLLPRLKRFTVVGTFSIGMYEYDSGLVLIHLEDAARLYRSDTRISGVRLKLTDVYEAPTLRKTLAREYGPDYYVSDWTREHVNFFRALNIEKRVMSIILFLIVSVAAFNIVSTLVMVVTDKRADIAILRTLGMSPRGVMGIFMAQGIVIGIIGTIVGAITGVLTSINIEALVPFFENLIGFKFFPPDVYVISDFPAEMHWRDVIIIVVISLLMSALATLYPAWRAARIQPAEALRFE